MSSRAYQGRYMIRRRQEEEHENHERWVISYADFITLLFAFFVVMYSISSVNEGKYKVLSDSLVSVFHAQSRTIDPVTVGEHQTRASNDHLIQLPVPGEFPSKEDYKYSIEGIFDDVKTHSIRQGKNTDNQVDYLTKISDKLAFALQQQMDAKEIQIKDNGEWVEVSIQASVLFPSGSASLSPKAKEIIGKVAAILKNSDNPIHVEGYTDNVPIETAQFPSNWELSAARAASVVRLFQEDNLAPERMAAVGYGEYHPVADNNTEEGRARNRRIALVISKSAPAAKPKEQQPPSYKMGMTNAAGTATSAPASASSSTANGEEVPLRILRTDNGSLLFSDTKNQPQAQPQAQPKQ